MARLFASMETYEAPPDTAIRATAVSRLFRFSLLSTLARSTTLDPLLKSLQRGSVDGQAEDPAPDGDVLLAAIAHQRDRGAFATLFRFYGPRLKGHLLMRGADSGTAEEIIQDVMLKVWQKAEQFDSGRGSASSWLYTLARNAFIDRVRREYRPEVDPQDPILSSPDSGADRLMIDAEVQRELIAGLEALPEEQQHVVKLAYFQGQSLAQISIAGGLPLGTVKTRARLALSHLRALVTHGRRDV